VSFGPERRAGEFLSKGTDGFGEVRGAVLELFLSWGRLGDWETINPITHYLLPNPQVL
jgi:hypothetical protein